MSVRLLTSATAKLGEQLVVDLVQGHATRLNGSVAPERLSQLWQWGVANKVVPQLAMALDCTGHADEVAARSRRQRLNRAMLEIAAAAKSAHVTVAFSKGFCFD